MFAKLWRAFVLGLIAALLSQPGLAAQPKCAGLLYASGFDHQPTHGSKDALIHAVNRGEPIRLGWELDFDRDGIPDLSHWSDATYLSVWQGEVFAQVHAVHAQRPLREEADMVFPDAYSEWRGSLGTTGRLEGAYSNGSNFPDDLSVRMTWCSGLPGPRGWTLLYRNSADGATEAGSKAALFAAIRSGQPIQIGWGFSVERDGETISVEHVASPIYLSIINEAEVSAQLPEHIAQQRYADIDQALFDDPAVMWRGLMTTKGVFDAVWTHRASGAVVRRHPQRAAMSWYAPSSAPLATPSLAVSGGVRRDEGRAEERFPN